MAKKKVYQFTMESEEFGAEVFEYSTIKERQAGLIRVIRKVTQLDDGVERTFTLTEREI